VALGADDRRAGDPQMPDEHEASDRWTALSVAVAVAVAVAVLGGAPAFPPAEPGPEEGPVYVELAAPMLEAPTVLRLPMGTRVGDLFALAGTSVPAGVEPERTVRSGESVVIGRMGGVEFGWMPGGRLLALGVPIPLNTASATDLAALPGIGPALADRIIERRRAAGPFGSFDDVGRVSGVGPKLVKVLKRYTRL
jgi:competence protein ComEA